MKLILKNGATLLYKNGMSLTGLNIDSVVAESKEDRANLRMLLTDALKVDNQGCYELGAYLASKSTLKQDYSLKDKLRIINTLSVALKSHDSVFYNHTKELEEKLLTLIQSI
ncbi:MULTISPECIES: hypothetical protein [Acinetobacter]|uniref:Uncharacterized protein n=1 Tax=Acinetobacter bereziniae NIPH 3 TaxID=1217651 RepID=N8X7K1_ACIBZ|nr:MULTISPECIES: hypothetical protein [Acinetobacter]ENV20407.1 hypothetical protein F963_03692 [Acinetobacter bereziniae NIPH 3]BCX74655.1 hypothetical protein TOL5_28550 [Acinetobacter sp. Tol 5]